MGREVRMVPPDWQHPKDELRGGYRALYPGSWYQDHAEEFMRLANEKGLQAAIEEHGRAPDANDYMLIGVPESECTHFMMYEDTSEGTPISPAFATPEELARWLVDNGASFFAGDTADYDTWMRVIRGGSVFLAVGPDMPLAPRVFGGEADGEP